MRPLSSVIRHLIDDPRMGLEVTHYLHDVDDHLQGLLNKLWSLKEECWSLKDEFGTYQDKRMNEVLYMLTLITAWVVPSQFLTGYFGMNFMEPNEKGDGEVVADPILKLGSKGIWGFWIFNLLTIFSILYIFRKKGGLNGSAFVFWRH